MVNYTKLGGNIMAEFKDILKQLRDEKGIYQKDLAEVVGVSAGAITMYETGRRFPDKDTLEKIANYFYVSVDYLLGRTKEKSTVDDLKRKLASDPKLELLLTDFLCRKDLLLLYKLTKDLAPEDVMKIIDIVKIIDFKGNI